MRKNYKKRSIGLLLLGFILASLGITAQTVTTFSYTGSMQTFTVPPCVSILTVDVRGAQGANALDKLTTNSTGGLGGRSQGVLTVTPGQVLNVFVGGAGNTNGNGGYNGGGMAGNSSAGSGCFGGYGGGGGGASDIRVNGTALANRIVVAGGGGGAGRDYCNGSCIPCGCGGSGGAGGGLSGVNGQPANNCGFSYPGSGTNYGAGGTSTAGGLLGPGDGGGPNGTAGALGVGGTGATGSIDVAGGGGGGGYYGGGGGGAASSGSGVGGGGGGGGSSYLGSLSSAATTQSFQTGDGVISLTYFTGVIASIATTGTAICTGQSATLSVPGMATYTWSNGSNNSTYVVSPTSNTSYSVTGTTTNGCPVVGGAITITVSSGAPVLSVVSSTNQTCLGKTATLTASGALTYSWSNNVTNGVSFSPSVTNVYTVTGTNGCGTSSAVTTITVAPLPVSVISSPTTVCAGSASTLTAVSGATSYSWMPVSFSGASLVVSPMSTTVYTVTVSDGTCAGVATVAVNALPVPTVVIAASTTLVCANVPVSLTASGGTSYNWTPGNLSGPNVTVSPSAPTLYSVSVTNSLGCSTGSAVAIITNPSPTVTLAASAILICSGDPVDLIASGASSYQWSSGPSTSSIQVNPISTTVYSVVGTDNGCNTTMTVEIAVFSPSLSVSGPTAMCSGQSATLSANGGDTYNWVNNGSPFQSITVSPTVTTIYTVTALTATGNINCPSMLAYQVIVNPNPTVTATPNRTVMCKGESNTIAASGASSYSWNTGATTSSISITATLITTYNYTVTGVGANGCSSAIPVQIKVNGCNGISETSGLSAALLIYPNPSSGEFTIQYDAPVTLELVNELGQRVKTIRLTEANNYKAQVSGLSKGVYFITAAGSAQRINQKIIVD